MNFNPEVNLRDLDLKDSKVGGGRAAIIVALITAVGAILVPVVQGIFNAPKSLIKPTIPFSGIVRDDSGKPVSQAKVTIAEDQGVPQVVRTDSDGIFHLEMLADSRSLRLTIDADGFSSLTKDASVRRTGPEEIYLHHLTNPRAPENKRRIGQNLTQGPNSPIITGNGNNLKY